MAAILGEKHFNNATGIDASIADVTNRLTEATTKYNQAMTGIALCNDKAWQCVDKSGRHISTWRDWRDTYGPMVIQLKKELSDLLALKKQMAVSTADTAQSSIVVAQAELAVAEAENVKVTTSFKKYLLIGGILLAVTIIGVVAYKKFKK